MLVVGGTGPSTSDPQTSALLAKLQLLPPDRRELVLALVKVLGEKWRSRLRGRRVVAIPTQRPGRDRSDVYRTGEGLSLGPR